jgi:cytochrome c-type biogenesis protein CcmF
MRLEVGRLIPLPVDLGGGKRLLLENFVPGTQQVLLRVEGLSLPTEPARAVIEVSTKPAIALVWAGALLMALGCGLAVVRRRLDLQPATAPARGRLRISEDWFRRRRAPLPGATLRT